MFVDEFDLGLGGVDVDVDAGRVDVYLDKIGGVVVVGDDAGVGFFDSCAEGRVFDESVVDEEVLLATAFAGKFGFGDVAADGGQVGLLVDGEEAFVVAVAKNLGDAFGKVARSQVVEQTAVAVERIVDVVVDQGHALEDFFDVAEFDAVAFKEVAAGRDVEEKVLDGDGSALGAGTGALFLDFAAFDNHPCSQFVVVETAFHFDLGDGGNRGKGFTAETHGVDGEEVVGLVDFGSGVTFEAEPGVAVAHAAAVVDDLYQGAAGVFNDKLYFGGTRVHGIFEQLLHSGGRAVDHFACGDLVGDTVGEYVDNVTHRA